MVINFDDDIFLINFFAAWDGDDSLLSFILFNFTLTLFPQVTTKSWEKIMVLVALNGE